ncbi:MAG: exodeoxyribonuclease VII large subunit [Pseudomonadota bacterium]|nr:exodeoxyribonuclease VII large subunit [Pseudomonadota bacterium]
MADQFFDTSERTSGSDNLVELTVGEVSQAVKRTLEGAFGHVRVRGEVGRPNYHGSGHLYFTLKDPDAAIDAVAWRGTVNKLPLRLEEGMEVIAIGRISSYPKNSRYQIVVEAIELAGEGALLKMLEERRKKLDAEGLFDPARKRELPFLPVVIGVITSPTGAVFRDILNRLEDRFPSHVLMWPVPVQGDGAAVKIAAAIDGFNAFSTKGVVPKPDVLIVARGGGSLEDLWQFNEEVVVRAAAASGIPLISAVGHETDTTLIDFASDHRASTPTAAAELVVPVRNELLARVLDDERRLVEGVGRYLEDRRIRLAGVLRGLPRPADLLETAMQSLDFGGERLVAVMTRQIERAASRFETAKASTRNPRDILELKSRDIAQLSGHLTTNLQALLRDRSTHLRALSVIGRMSGAIERSIGTAETALQSVTLLLNGLSYERVLERGFALVRADDGRAVIKAQTTKPGQNISIQFSDGEVGAKIRAGTLLMKSSGKKVKEKPNKKGTVSKNPSGQGSLF